MGLLLSIVDASIVSTALVTIGHYFNNFIEVAPAFFVFDLGLMKYQIYWIVLAYLLSYMSKLP